MHVRKATAKHGDERIVNFALPLHQTEVEIGQLDDRVHAPMF